VVVRLASLIPRRILLSAFSARFAIPVDLPVVLTAAFRTGSIRGEYDIATVKSANNLWQWFSEPGATGYVRAKPCISFALPNVNPALGAESRIFALSSEAGKLFQVSFICRIAMSPAKPTGDLLAPRRRHGCRVTGSAMNASKSWDFDDDGRSLRALPAAFPVVPLLVMPPAEPAFFI
jgi:hypothetical protein